jgi:hypothetical protein
VILHDHRGLRLPVSFVKVRSATKIRILFFYPSTDTRDNEEGFRIYRISVKDTTKIAEVGPNVTLYVDKDALAGASYAVSAYNSAGESSPSNTACLPD